jgi:hypothetical protein
VSLATRVNEVTEPINGYPCSVAALIGAVTARGGADELAVLQRILYGKPGLTEPTRGHRGLTERQVYEIVTAEGYDVAQTQINVHRGRKCRCYRDAR